MRASPLLCSFVAEPIAPKAIPRRRAFQTLAAASAFMVAGGLGTGVVQAENFQAAVLSHAEIGLDGVLKLGRWTPIEATIEAPAGTSPDRVRLVVESVDPDGDPVSYPSESFALAPGANRVRSLFQLGRQQSTLAVRLQADSGVLHAQSFSTEAPSPFRFGRPLRQSAILIGLLGDPSLADALKSDAADSTGRVVARLSPEALPADPLAYDAMDVLFVCGVPDVSQESLLAIRKWVWNGGHLVMAVGADAERYRDSGWASILPVKVVGSSRPRELSGVESFAGKSRRIAIAGSVKAARIDPAGVEVRISGLDGPLLVRTAHGFGAIDFFGLDVDRPPLSRWDSRGELLKKLTGATESSGGTSGSRGGQIAKAGLTDLATQFRGSHESFPEVRRHSIWTVLGLIGASILLLGPLDYVLVHRLLGRPQWTWITLPILVIGLTAAAIGFARSSNGDSSRVHQVEVVDIDAATAHLRGHVSLSLYSNATQRLSVRARPETTAWSSAPVSPPQTATVSWEGLPEERFGGMYREAGMGIARSAYTISPRGAAIDDLPVAIWSARSLAAEWDASAPQFAESRLSSPLIGQLSGAIVHRLPGPLTDWVLAYGNRVYLPRDRSAARSNVIAPHVSWSPNRSDVSQRELLGYLTGTIATRVKKEESKLGSEIQVEQSDWNLLANDPVDVLRMITFHEKSDGRKYTGLSNDSWRRWEMSSLLEMGRAVLFARLETPRGVLAVDVGRGDGKDAPVPTTHTTIVRLVFPVQRVGTVPDQLPDYNQNPVKPKLIFPKDDAPAEAEIPSPSTPPDAEPKSP